MRMASTTVLFESWRGRYDDNPRAISEAMGSVRPDLSPRWVTSGSSLPEGLRGVRRNRANYFRLLATVDHFVNNDMTPRLYPSGRRFQTYLQTWHGTPLKRIGFDTESDAVPQQYFDRLQRDVARWTHLISPSPEITEILRSAFRFQGTVLESGYPRNDVLFGRCGEQLRNRTRQRLGIDAGEQVILYAPTWRDNVLTSGGAPAWVPDFDLSGLLPRLARDAVILQRLHPVIAASAPAFPSSRLRDVSAYPDIAALYAAADVLVTDYSSAMFDFAVTGKPIILFPFDKGRYERDCRGTYFDIDEIAPGPVVTRLDDLGDALQALDDFEASYTLRYSRFRDRFLPYEDGTAAQRAIEGSFGVA